MTGVTPLLIKQRALYVPPRRPLSRPLVAESHSSINVCVCDVGVRVCAGVWCASEPGGMIPLLDQCVCGVDVCVCAGVRYAAEHVG